jgi:Right handed beta helix region
MNACHGAVARGLAVVVLATALVLVNVAGTAQSAQSGCLGSGTEASINAALVGAGAVAELCPGAVFDLHHEVRFTAPNQRIRTQGLPAGDARALLRVASPELITAINGKDQSGVVVENLRVDGSRPQFGWRVPTAALIELGGNVTGQTVQHVVAQHPRGWSIISLYHGDIVNRTPTCQGARIINNTLGPGGNDDGTIADGISLACGHSLVEGNLIRDVTDGGIVIFGAPGSQVVNNTIIAETKVLAHGIGLADYRPMDGNYTGTLVDRNIIDARSAFIRVGVLMGSRAWGWCDTPQYNYGARVTNNVLRGLHMGYGFVMAGVTEWTVQGNVDQSRHVGRATQGCGGTQTLPSHGFLYEPAYTGNVNRQSDFRAGVVSDVVSWTVEPPILTFPVQAPTSCGRIDPDQGLLPGQSVSSCDGRFQLALHPDSNLVLYQGNTPIWYTNTSGRWAAELLMQSDGNLVLYHGTGTGLFFTNTYGHDGAFLAIQNDGNLVVYTPGGSPLWASNTCCR